MRNFLLAAVGMLSLTALASPPPQAGGQQGSKFFPYPMKCDRLENGLTVCRVPFESPGLVAYYTAMRVGSRNEVEKGRSGFAHFFEHMMFRGTKKWPGTAREKFISEGGFHDNAFTTSDITVYNTFGPNRRLLELIEIEADRFQNLEYEESAFRTEALAVLGEYHKNAANPSRKVDEVLANTAYMAHTYKHTTMGFYEDIKAMPEAYEYSKEFFKRWYTPDNAFIFVVGDFNDEEVMATIRKHYGSWKGTTANLPIPKEPQQKDPRQAHIPWPTPTLPRVVLAWHTPGLDLDRPDTAIKQILGSYLVGPTSPLYRELVLEKALAEQVGMWSSFRRDPSLFAITATVKEDKSRAVAQAAFERAVKELVSGKVDAKRVQAIKDNLRYGFLMELESPADVAVQLAWFTGLAGTPEALDRLYQSIEKVKPQDLVTFAKRYLVDSNRTTVTLTHEPRSGAAPQQGGSL